jgi:hypothetical protein
VAGLKCEIINLKSEIVQVNETCLVINRDSGKFLKISDEFETGVGRCVRSHLSSLLSVFLASPVLAFPKTVCTVTQGGLSAQNLITNLSLRNCY